MREGVYNAVDIYLGNIVINSAVRVKFTALSPFNIRLGKDNLILYCCGCPITPIIIQKADILGERKTTSGTKVKDICLLATDRVRIQHSTNCHFKRCNVGCRFCEVENHEFQFTMKDIFEAIQGLESVPEAIFGRFKPLNQFKKQFPGDPTPWIGPKIHFEAIQPLESTQKSVSGQSNPLNRLKK